jgi:hypothetical protein
MPLVWVAMKRINFFKILIFFLKFFNLIIASESQKTGGALNGIPVVVAMSRIFK